MDKKPSIYNIPYKFRRIENLHILLWLLKDTFWALNMRYPAIFMIIPTLAVAMLITYQTRKITSELLHNLAVDFWITANCTWMVGEFYGWDANLIGPYGLREFSIIPFAAGLITLGYYYLFVARKKDFQEKIVRQTEELILDTDKRDQGRGTRD
ncbi:MAG: hypothetical protein ACK5AO_03905 [bacterium]|jgi:hypothetical protein